jgi:hypothetical protein
MPSLRDASLREAPPTRTAGFAYAFLTNRRGTENTEEEKRRGDRMVEIFQAIAFLIDNTDLDQEPILDPLDTM